MKKNLLLLLVALLALNLVGCKEDDGKGNGPEPTPVSMIEGAFVGEFTYELLGATKQYTPYRQLFTITLKDENTATMDMSNILGFNKSFPDLKITREGDGFKLSETVELVANSTKMEIEKLTITFGAEQKLVSMVVKTSFKAGADAPYVDQYRISTEAKAVEKACQPFISGIKWTADPDEIVVGDPKVENVRDAINLKDEKYYGMIRYTGTITYYTLPNPTPEDLAKLTCELLASDEALHSVKSIKPDYSGWNDFLDFNSSVIMCTVISKDNLSYTDYSVVRGDGVALSSDKTYKFDALDWNLIDKKSPNMNYYEPKDWVTSNSGIYSIKSMMSSYYSPDKPYVVTKGPAAEAYEAKGLCAKLQTVMTNEVGTGSFIPKVTAGSLFLGTFETNMNDVLASTKFGVIYKGSKLLIVRGQYKYAPGVQFWNNMELDKSGKLDKGSAVAVLYEVSKYTETLNGHDLSTSDKIVASAKVVCEPKTEYTDFTLTMDYKKSYDPSKKYKLAVVFSSSIEGDKYFGAVGSTLWIDQVVIDAE